MDQQQQVFYIVQEIMKKGLENKRELTNVEKEIIKIVKTKEILPELLSFIAKNAKILFFVFLALPLCASPEEEMYRSIVDCDNSLTPEEESKEIKELREREKEIGREIAEISNRSDEILGVKSSK